MTKDKIDKELEEAFGTDAFLPENYNVPVGKSGYMKFKVGKNKFRILTSPILGYEGWVTTADDTGKEVRKPVRVRMSESISVDAVDNPEEVKHFWAMPVWNYDDKKVQILEITQKGIQKSIKALSSSEDWGSPLKYDLLVTKEGEKMATEYQTNPIPPVALPSEAQEAWDKVKDKIKLDALYEGKDPFEALKV